jgi:hypothetical protein
VCHPICLGPIAGGAFIQLVVDPGFPQGFRSFDLAFPWAEGAANASAGPLALHRAESSEPGG